MAKTRLCTLYAFFLLFSLPLLAQEDFERKSLWDYHPIHVGGNYIQLEKSKVQLRRGQGYDGTLKFNKANAFIYCFVPVCKMTFLLPRVEWNTFELNWNRNLRFREKRFQYVQFALTMLSMGLEKWRWIARADYNIDTKHFSQPKTFGLFSALLWGTHELGEKWHYHVGATGYSGFEGQQVYPIIGLDYAPTKKWLFQVVFPVTYAIEYSFNKEWRLSLKGRPLKERFRVDGSQPSPRSIFNYSTIGAELNLHYEKYLRLEIELFAGYNFGGSFYLKDQHGQNPLYTDLEGAPYFGASLNWGI